EFATATDSVAEYLYLDSATPLGRDLQRCRNSTAAKLGSATSPEVQVRSFGLRQVGGSNSQVPTAVAELLSQHLLQLWRGINTPVVVEQQVNLSDVGALLTAHGAAAASTAIP